MFKETLRIFAVLLLIIIAIMDDFPVYNKMKDVTTQLLLAVVVISCIYFDTTFGFILGLVLMLIYYEIYKKIKVAVDDIEIAKVIGPYNESSTSTIPEASNASCSIIKLDYISKEHLLAVQNNIFDTNNYTSEVKGVDKGFNNEDVYGAQGLDIDHLNYIGYSSGEHAMI